MSDYNCSKHGNIGHPDCKECIENTKRLCSDNGAYIIGLE